jgi:hypothetical protein
MATTDTAKLRAVTQEDYDGFVSVGRKYVEANPGFNERLQEASKQGWDFSAEATAEIIRRKRPDVADFLAQPENSGLRVKVMSLKGERAVEEIGRIASLIDRIGFGRDYTPNVSDTDAYLQKRRHEIRYGYRRR